MKLSKGQIIDCVDFDVNNIQHKFIDIKNIEKQQEFGVYDITTSTGFFQDINDIFHKQCSSHSLEYIKKYGLDLDNLDSISAPAKHARSLSVHLNTYLSSMQAYYAGALGVAYVNIMYAPYIENMTDDEVYQEAQHLIFQASQNAFTRGGQSVKGDERLIIHDSQDNSIIYPTIKEFHEKLFEKNRFLTLSLNKETGKTEWKPVYGSVCHERKDKLMKVTLANGTTGVFTEDHSLFTVNEEGKIVETLTSESDNVIVPFIDSPIYDKLNITKYLTCYEEDNDFITRNKAPYDKSIKKEFDLNYDFGLVFGAYVGDGCRANGSGGIHISCFDDQHRSVLSDKIHDLFDVDVYVNKSGRSQGVGVHNKLLQELFANMCGVHAKNKKIPDEILFGPKEVLTGFIDGYISADGCVSDNKIETYTISKLLSEQIQIAYLRLGIKSRKRIKYVKGEERCIDGYNFNANYDVLVNTIGIYDFDKVRFIKQSRENKRLEQLDKPRYSFLNHNDVYREYDGYRYDAIKKLIKQTFRSKLSLKSNRIDTDTLITIQQMIKKSLVELDNIKEDDYASIIKTLYLCENISANTGQNTTDKDFCLRDVNANKDIFDTIVTNQSLNLNNLCIAIDRILNVIPYDATIEESEFDDNDVYDISVVDNENFVLLNGIVAHNTLFIDFNIHTGIPGYLKNIKAIGPGGKYTGKTYGDYEAAAIRFTKALLKVWGKGDAAGTPMAFPKLDFHVNEETFKNKEQKAVFEYACKITAKTGIVYFVFDRDEVTLSACCRLRTTISDNYMIKHPESMRFAGFQNITINLPQCAYKSGKDMDVFYQELEKTFQLCIKAHLDKKKFVTQVMNAPGTPLWQVGRVAKDGRPYVDLEKSTYIIGLIGLNEALEYITGKELHADDDSLWTGIRMISYLYFLAKEATLKYDLKFTLEESPAESASRRLAKIDMHNFPNDVITRGSVEKDQIYYTNSIHIRPDADVDLLSRIVSQAKFHNLIESGAIIHAFVGEKLPSTKSIANIVHKTFKNTNAAQLTISPEFTICKCCNKTIVGLSDSCQHCGAYNVYGVEYGEFADTMDKWDKDILKEIDG